jgi:hypothetical protein
MNDFRPLIPCRLSLKGGSMAASGFVFASAKIRLAL